VTDFKFCIPEGIKDPADHLARLTREPPLVNHQEIHIRSQAQFPPSITAEGRKCDASLMDFFGLVAERGLKKQRPNKPVHKVGVAPGGEKSRTLGELFLDEGVSGFQKILADLMRGVAVTRWRPRLLLLF
jgi:hypothetical protein